MKQRLLLAFKRLLSLFPTPLPIGMTQFDTWVNSIIELAGPVADPDSMRFVISSLLINSSPSQSKMPKNYFVRSLHKAATKQLASSVFTKIKEQQKLAEDTATKKEAVNGEKQTS